MTPAQFTDWLANTPLSLAIQTTTWAIPTIQTIHILSLAVVLASILMVDLRLLRLAWRNEPVSTLSRRFLRPVWYILVVLLLTGATLVIAEPGRSLTNSVFITKMCLLATVIVLTLLMLAAVRRKPALWDGPRLHFGAVAFALVSILLWFSITVAGRLIAYLD